MAYLVECYACGMEYPPTQCRWRCPMCGAKDSCCDGEPQPKIPEDVVE